MANIILDGVNCEGIHIQTANSNILLLKGRRGLLGCGYFDLAAANRLGDAFVIVRGVKTFDDMLSARAAEVSTAASQLGVQEGMSGREVMNLLNREP